VCVCVCVRVYVRNMLRVLLIYGGLCSCIGLLEPFVLLSSRNVSAQGAGRKLDAHTHSSERLRQCAGMALALQGLGTRHSLQSETLCLQGQD
jgi:hypothetical protein